MEELNNEILKKVISALPQYEAPGFIWEEIENSLVEKDQDDALKALIPTLSVFTPPESVWSGIESELKNSSTKTSGNIRILYLGKIAAAASLVGFLFWFGWNQFTPSQKEYTMVYSQEEVAQFDYSLDTDEDEAAFTAMLSQFESSVVAKQHEEYDVLIDEYQELKNAKDELVEMMENYGNDPDLIQQISNIEHERSRVIKKMAALI